MYYEHLSYVNLFIPKCFLLERFGTVVGLDFSSTTSRPEFKSPGPPFMRGTAADCCVGYSGLIDGFVLCR